MGHEFWAAVQRDVIIALAVLVEENDGNRRILHLEVAPPRKNEGVGSALVKAIIKAYPKRVLSVVPFAGAEEFYTHLGFSKVGRWEMRRDPRAIKH